LGRGGERVAWGRSAGGNAAAGATASEGFVGNVEPFGVAILNDLVEIRLEALNVAGEIDGTLQAGSKGLDVGACAEATIVGALGESILNVLTLGAALGRE